MREPNATAVASLNILPTAPRGRRVGTAIGAHAYHSSARVPKRTRMIIRLKITLPSGVDIAQGSRRFDF